MTNAHNMRNKHFIRRIRRKGVTMLVLTVDTGNKAIRTENLSFNSGIQTMDMMPGEKEEVLRYRGKGHFKGGG